MVSKIVRALPVLLSLIVFPCLFANSAFAEQGDSSSLTTAQVSDSPLTVDPMSSGNVSNVNMYRLYNVLSGEHFYSSSASERDHLIDLGWFYEGVGWMAPSTSPHPVYRLYNPYAGDHHYTLAAQERDHLKSVGWNDEGIGWYSAEDTSKPVLRQYNPNAKAGTHNFTLDRAENDYLAQIGWHAEGIGWYAAGPGHSESMTFYNSNHLKLIVAAVGSNGGICRGYNTSISESAYARVASCTKAVPDASFVAINARTGKCIASNADRFFYGASAIKAPYCAALCKYSVPGVQGVRTHMYNSITYSSNDDFNYLFLTYRRSYFDAFARESGIASVNYVYDTFTADFSPRQLAELWLTTRSYILSNHENAAMFRGSFGNGAYYKAGWMYGGFSGTVYHLAGIQGDVVYAIMSSATYPDGSVSALRDAIVAAVG